MDAVENSTIQIVLSELKSGLLQRYGDRIERLVLYGSRARGDYDAESDIDVAIIVKDLERETKLDILDVVADLELKHLVPLSTLVLSCEAYADLLHRERRIALDIEDEGIPL